MGPIQPQVRNSGSVLTQDPKQWPTPAINPKQWATLNHDSEMMGCMNA